MTDIIKNGINIGRRAFIRGLGMTVSLTMLGIKVASKVYADAMDYLTARINSVYSHDSVMRYRKSQDNPFVKKLYSDFFPHPYCEKSEHLLHAEYVDRSGGVKKVKDVKKRLKYGD
jgi:hypothetical protein